MHSQRRAVNNYDQLSTEIHLKAKNILNKFAKSPSIELRILACLALVSFVGFTKVLTHKLCQYIDEASDEMMVLITPRMDQDAGQQQELVKQMQERATRHNVDPMVRAPIYRAIGRMRPNDEAIRGWLLEKFYRAANQREWHTLLGIGIGLGHQEFALEQKLVTTLLDLLDSSQVELRRASASILLEVAEQLRQTTWLALVSFLLGRKTIKRLHG